MKNFFYLQILFVLEMGHFSKKALHIYKQVDKNMLKKAILFAIFLSLFHQLKLFLFDYSVVN
jgi:hypothetical protein